MELNLLKKNSLIEKEEAFMPIAFLDLSIPAAAIAFNGKVIGHEINKEFKKTVYPIPDQPPVLAFKSITMSSRELSNLRESISDVEF